VNKVFSIFAALLAMALAGCGPLRVATDPNTFSVEPGSVAHLRAEQAVALKNGFPAAVEVRMPQGSGVTWSADLRELTETAIAMLGKALEKQGIRVVPEAEKTVTLRVANLQAGMYGVMIHPRVRATLVLEAQYPDGTATSVHALNTSPMGAPRAIDGAVLFALNDLVRHEQFVAYVNGSK
jgi:hypothetical protein